MNKRVVLGVLLATVAVFLWGMIYWGFNPLPYDTWNEVPDEAAAAQAIRDNFPEEGTYYLPQMSNDKDRLAELYEAGPVAFVHVTDADGRPQFEPVVPGLGFLLYLMVVLVVTWILRRVIACLPAYKDRVVLCALLGLAAVLLINFGDMVFWYMPVAWQLHLAFYNFSAFVIIGLVLGYFVTPETAAP